MAEPTQTKTPDVNELRGRKLGQILVKLGHVTRDQINEALDLQQQQRMPIGQLLVELGYIGQSEVSQALAAQAGMETKDIGQEAISPDVVKLLPAETARAYQVMPLRYDKTTNTLTVALKDPNNFRAVDDLKLLMGFNVKTVVADPDQVDAAINKNYQDDSESLASLMDELESDEALKKLDTGHKVIDLDQHLAAAEDNKVKRLLNLVLLQAIRDKASDIHFEPFEDEYKMRYRVDGVLYEMIPPPKHLSWAISSRIKVMSNLDIAERRLPQDGRIELLVQGAPVDLRVSTLPTMFGESVVMRVLDRSNVALDLEKVCSRQEDLAIIRKLMARPNGIVIVTGPTGSGKTTTLYSILGDLNDEETKILTSEDPVEYDIDGLIQVQINEDQGLTFARALRAFLRQDPDIILVGEIRDGETAQIAVQASLTGHLVFSTLHTNDAPSSIARLLDLNLEPFLITATIEGIIAQRLVRKICSNCKEKYVPSEEQLYELSLTPEEVTDRVFFRGTGCDVCAQSGYKGRMSIFEIMTLDDELKELVLKNSSTQVLAAEARKRGMRTLRQAGLLGIYDGITTIDEVVRETAWDDA